MDWLPAMELQHTSELVQDYHKSYPTKPGPLTHSDNNGNNRFFFYDDNLYTIKQTLL